MTTQVTINGARGSFEGAVGTVNFAADEMMNVNFYNKAVPDPIGSLERGRPWSRSMIYVRIQHPGEKDYVDRPVQDFDVAKTRWARQWAAFERQQEQVPNGTPVDVLFPQSPEIAANLHSIAIHTVEQLAGLTAHGMQTVGMGATQWQAKAKQFLDAARGGSAMHRLQLENDRQRNAIESLTNQVAQLNTIVERLAAEKSGVPPNLIPRSAPTAVQAHASEASAYAPLPELSDEPLFHAVEDDEVDGVSGPSIGAPTQLDPPRRVGWPKGKPRRPRPPQ